MSFWLANSVDLCLALSSLYRQEGSANESVADMSQSSCAQQHERCTHSALDHNAHACWQILAVRRRINILDIPYIHIREARGRRKAHAPVTAPSKLAYCGTSSAESKERKFVRHRRSHSGATSLSRCGAVALKVVLLLL